MPFRGIADVAERSVLTVALTEYCEENRIEPTSEEYEYARQLLILLYERQGHRTVAELKAALIAAIRHAL
jgi:hypothetical protein